MAEFDSLSNTGKELITVHICDNCILVYCCLI
jgi:hypothetical protein